METRCTNLEQGKSGIATRIKGEMEFQAIKAQNLNLKYNQCLMFCIN